MMISLLLCALALPCVAMASDTKQDERAARAFERNMVADEVEASRAQKDYERARVDSHREAAAHAQADTSARNEAALRRKLPRTPKWGIELRFGPYRPKIASDKEVQDLYTLVFASERSTWFTGRPVQMGLEVDAYPLRSIGLLGVFGRVAYWRATGPTRLCVDANQNPVMCTSESVFDSLQGNDQATLSIVPLSAGVVWRIDALRRWTPVPVQFNVKAGLDYHFWWANAGDVASTYLGQKARGGTLGFNLSVGAAFGLEIFSKATLANRSSGIKNALFIEYQLVEGAALAGKDRSHRLDCTDTKLVLVGLSCDFL